MILRAVGLPPCAKLALRHHLLMANGVWPMLPHASADAWDMVFNRAVVRILLVT